MIRRPDAIPPSLNTMKLVVFKLIIEHICSQVIVLITHIYHPNLLLMVNKSKKMEVNERIKPNIINGLDLTFSSFLCSFFEEEKFLSFFL